MLFNSWNSMKIGTPSAELSFGRQTAGASTWRRTCPAPCLSRAAQVSRGAHCSAFCLGRSVACRQVLDHKHRCENRIPELATALPV